MQCNVKKESPLSDVSTFRLYLMRLLYFYKETIQ
jgi:hypothetical protein